MSTTVLPARPAGRTSALLTAAGVLFIAVPPVVELVSGDAFVLVGLALLLVVAALPGLRRAQQGRDGAWGRWGLALTAGGLGTMVVLVLAADPLDAALDGSAQAVAEGTWLLLAAAAATSAVGGVIAFSVAMTRAHVLASGAIWLFLGGMVVGLLSESFEQSLAGPVPWLADVLPPLSFVVAGCGLLALARSVRRETAQAL